MPGEDGRDIIGNSCGCCFVYLLYCGAVHCGHTPTAILPTVWHGGGGVMIWAVGQIGSCNRTVMPSTAANLQQHEWNWKQSIATAQSPDLNPTKILLQDLERAAHKRKATILNELQQHHKDEWAKGPSQLSRETESSYFKLLLLCNYTFSSNKYWHSIMYHVWLFFWGCIYLIVRMELFFLLCPDTWNVGIERMWTVDWNTVRLHLSKEFVHIRKDKISPVIEVTAVMC